MINIKSLLILFSAVCLLAGCAGRSAPPQQKPVTVGYETGSVNRGSSAPRQNYRFDSPRKIEEGSSAAVVTLWRQYQLEADADKTQRATATLERALRIEPRNPFLWQQLAKIKLDQEQPRQAVAMARKSNSLAVGNPYVQLGNWRIIHEAKDQLDDDSGADFAEERIEFLEEAIARKGTRGG